MKAKVIAKYVLASLITFGFFGLLYLLIFNEIYEENKDILNIVIGSLISAFTGVVAFFFGSSQSSQDKTEMLGK
jgi:ABC-type Na+ efflux pump permease subunit